MPTSCPRLSPVALGLLAASVALLACGGSSSDGGIFPGLGPQTVALRAVDGASASLPAAPPGLAPASISCPAGAVVRRVRTILAGDLGPIIGLRLGCSFVSLVDDGAGETLRLSPIANQPAVGTVVDFFDLLECPDDSLSTGIDTRLDASQKLLGIDFECVTIGLEGDGADTELVRSAPFFGVSGGREGAGTATGQRSCLDPAVDGSEFGVLVGVEVHAGSDLGALVPRCQRLELVFP